MRCPQQLVAAVAWHPTERHVLASGGRDKIINVRHAVPCRAAAALRIAAASRSKLALALQVWDMRQKSHTQRPNEPVNLRAQARQRLNAEVDGAAPANRSSVRMIAAKAY